MDSTTEMHLRLVMARHIERHVGDVLVKAKAFVVKKSVGSRIPVSAAAAA